jgi:hypothetical protein
MDLWYILLSFDIFSPLLVQCGTKDLATLATRARNVFARKTEKGGEVRVFFAFLVPKKLEIILMPGLPDGMFSNPKIPVWVNLDVLAM